MYTAVLNVRNGSDMPECSDCPVKKELINLAEIANKILDDTRRYTWSEKAGYKIEVDKMIKRLKGEDQDVPE